MYRRDKSAAAARCERFARSGWADILGIASVWLTKKVEQGGGASRIWAYGQYFFNMQNEEAA